MENNLPRFPEMAETLRKVEARAEKQESEMMKLRDDMRKWKEKMETRAEEQEREIRKMRKEMDDWKTEMTNSVLKKLELIEKKVEKVEIDLNARERHSRSWSVRMVNDVKEEKNEDPEKIVRKIFETIPAAKNVDFDIVHRVGRKDQGGERPRQFLIRLAKKSDTRMLLSGEIRTQLYRKGYPIFPDLTALDKEKKTREFPEIKKLMDQGKKARFENGFWIVNGRRFVE